MFKWRNITFSTRFSTSFQSKLVKILKSLVFQNDRNENYFRLKYVQSVLISSKLMPPRKQFFPFLSKGDGGRRTIFNKDHIVIDLTVYLVIDFSLMVLLLGIWAN